jgi:UDP-2-acetamido-2,6-beta-L-arabino-hexul-4-ose reductase
MSCLPETDLAYDLTVRRDERGFLVEFLRSPSCGQIIVSTTELGAIRGGHYHDSKVEKFLAWGDAVIRLQHVLSGETVEYRVSRDNPRVVDIPPGYAHWLQNVGHDVLTAVIWSSEVYSPSCPDTHPVLPPYSGAASLPATA